MPERLIDAIDRYQEAVFEYKAGEIAASFMALVNALEVSLAAVFRPEDRPLLNRILEIMLDAYQNQDYLLVADLAEYKLKPLIQSDKNRSDNNGNVC